MKTKVEQSSNNQGGVHHRHGEDEEARRTREVRFCSKINGGANGSRRSGLVLGFGSKECQEEKFKLHKRQMSDPYIPTYAGGLGSRGKAVEVVQLEGVDKKKGWGCFPVLELIQETVVKRRNSWRT